MRETEMAAPTLRIQLESLELRVPEDLDKGFEADRGGLSHRD
jgi:hypothetical protein